MNCKSCHGPNGEGKYAGPRAGDGLTVAQWITQVRTPRANMPMYSPNQVSDQQIADMNAYMQTLTKPASFAREQYPVADSDPAGKKHMVAENCVACHADPAAFVQGRFTNNNRQVTTEAVLTQLRTPANRMPSFNATQVTDAQAAEIADFLRSLAAAAPAAQATAAPTAMATGAATMAPAAGATAAATRPATLPTTGGSAGVVAPLLALAGTAALGIGLAVRRLRKR
jgi:mono/diheme cytochrome c family protein